jgi:roadblock/LC7 domain-containing protein
MKIEGVVAAGQFSENGKIIRIVGELPEDLMKKAELCIRQNKTCQDFLTSLNNESPREYGSLVGWTVWGSKYSVVVVGNTRVFVETSRGDFNQLMVDLVGSEASGPRPRNY